MGAEAPPVEALDLRESLSLTLAEGVSSGSITKPDGSVIKLGFDHQGAPKDGGLFDESGRVPLQVIRPGLGRGRGRHLYEAAMLESNAEKFTGWKQYVNHLSPEAKRAQGGLPRDVRDLGGRITESWWDPTVPATNRFGQGSVVGMSKPTPFMGALIDHDPEIVEASISATATGVKPGRHQGEQCWIVEGIEDKGSVDWVTEAGAGGRIVSIMEAEIERDAEGRLALLASMSDDEFMDHLHNERPDLAEAMSKKKSPPKDEEDPEDMVDGGVDEEEEDAAAAAKKKRGGKQMTESEEDDMPITPEALREALATEENRVALIEALDLESLLVEGMTAVLREHLPELLEGALSQERDLIRATAKADADRRVQVERMRNKAHGAIEETSLPAVFKNSVKSKFEISEETGEPTTALNVIDDVNDDGEVTKKAEDKLAEAVADEIKQAQALYAAANPTRVRGQGPSGGSVEETEGDTPPKKSAPLMESLFRDAGFADPDKVYDLQA